MGQTTLEDWVGGSEKGLNAAKAALKLFPDAVHVSDRIFQVESVPDADNLYVERTFTEDPKVYPCTYVHSDDGGRVCVRERRYYALSAVSVLNRLIEKGLVKDVIEAARGK